MNTFIFETDDQATAFCEEIVRQMVEIFGITREESIGRINREWQGLKLVSPDDVIYHEDEIYWAKTIYYGKGSNWWLNSANLKPRPYPN